MAVWIAPGSPIEGGKGWRIWYSWPANDLFTPQPVSVVHNQTPVAVKQTWRVLPALAGLDRVMGVRTVELNTTAPGEFYEIHVPESGRSEPFRWRSLPHKIGEEGVSFLLASCFWHDSDREGTYSAAMQELTGLWNPAFKLLVGDQVYADWPSDETPDFTGNPEVELYAARYEQYWGDPLYLELLQTCPTYFMCDDHEFWNDYPERQIHLSRTWRAGSRAKYGQAARELYERYQRCVNPGDDAWYSFTIDTVSFFVADSRSQRNQLGQDPAHFFQEPQWASLELWARKLRGPGVLVIGQPLFQKDGNWRDHSLSNFVEDYGRLWSVIETCLQGRTGDQKPHDILVLSGDIHTGRFATGSCGNLDAPVGVPELIASPASMIRPGSKEPQLPPDKFTVHHQGQDTAWQVQLEQNDEVPTLNNNVALVRMLPGTNGRVLFELSIYQVRPQDPRSWWDRLLDDQPPSGSLRPLFRKELELR